MAKPTVATMSKIGFIVDEIPLMIAKQMDYWFAGKRNQSTWIDNIESFDYILAANQGNKEAVLSAVKESLTNLYRELFTRVDVTTDASPDGNYDANYTLIFAVRVIHEGIPYDLAESVLVTEQTYQRIKEGRRNAQLQS